MFYDINVEESTLFQESLPVFPAQLPPAASHVLYQKIDRSQ